MSTERGHTGSQKRLQGDSLFVALRASFGANADAPASADLAPSGRPVACHKERARAPVPREPAALEVLVKMEMPKRETLLPVRKGPTYLRKTRRASPAYLASLDATPRILHRTGERKNTLLLLPNGTFSGISIHQTTKNWARNLPKGLALIPGQSRSQLPPEGGSDPSSLPNKLSLKLSPYKRTPDGPSLFGNRKRQISRAKRGQTFRKQIVSPPARCRRPDELKIHVKAIK